MLSIDPSILRSITKKTLLWTNFLHLIVLFIRLLYFDILLNVIYHICSNILIIWTRFRHRHMIFIHFGSHHINIYWRLILLTNNTAILFNIRRGIGALLFEFLYFTYLQIIWQILFVFFFSSYCIRFQFFHFLSFGILIGSFILIQLFFIYISFKFIFCIIIINSIFL